ncbi:hypothetical protein DFP80_103172 [Marinomonas rhizomae]|uniref:Uncharacterized protein n=1 Tax=Marinomonas rhizomae TaxID=491948 RepID=A0A366JE85_9GAMM|nr:hypothetical protein DFP80_103172 [Marinomonas rhizomae]
MVEALRLKTRLSHEEGLFACSLPLGPLLLLNKRERAPCEALTLIPETTLKLLVFIGINDIN